MISYARKYQQYLPNLEEQRMGNIILIIVLGFIVTGGLLVIVNFLLKPLIPRLIPGSEQYTITTALLFLIAVIQLTDFLWWVFIYE